MSTPRERLTPEGLIFALAPRPPARREARIRRSETCVLVEVELRGPARNALFSHLGSLTEREGMALYRHGPAKERMRVSVAVPRAHTPSEAEAVVASLLERIRRSHH